MVIKRILVSWIGHTDIRAMGRSLSPAIRKKLVPVVGDIDDSRDRCGPVRTLLDIESFDSVHLISNYPPFINRQYRRWLGCDPKIHSARLTNPTDYKEIFVIVDSIMREIVEDCRVRTDLAILLSPGTPAMAAVWVLLGKSKYPARFYQTAQGKAWETDIPFDLTVDFVPELLRESDATLQHLAMRSPKETEGFDNIVGDSKSLRLAVGRACKAALRDVSVLLLGESGTGKELFARAIHAASRRRDRPFVAINCAAIPRDLLESELFGHVKGAFTGAIQARDGAFVQADGGTLFLDEVGDCDPVIQAKLLRVLQSPVGEPITVREFCPIGGSKVVRSDVRVIAATNRDLLGMIEVGAFREDLFYRLSVVSIQLPPLRDRVSDMPILAQTMLDRINSDFLHQEPGYKNKSFSASANIFVKQYRWPGNIRQLNNVIVQAAIMSEADSLTDADLRAAITEVPGASAKEDVLSRPLGDRFNIDRLMAEIQVYYLQRAMNEAGGNKSKAARLLGMKNYQTLDAQLKRLNVDWKGSDT